MSEPHRIADQLERSQNGPAWHGPSLGELLAGVDAAMSQWRPLRGTHNVWELLLHVTGWQAAALNAVNGGRMPKLAELEDWPAGGSTELEWRGAVQKLDQISRELVGAVSKFSDERLSDTVPGRNYSFYFLLHGVAQHNLYHAGQIAMLKAAAREQARGTAQQR